MGALDLSLPSWALLATLSGGLMACGAASQPSAVARDLYLDAVMSPNKDRALALCDAIAEPELTGDCTVAVLQAQGASAADEPVCAALTSERWRAECTFVLAEAAHEEGQTAEAEALCERAGDFGRDCREHLWKRETKEALRRSEGAESLREAARRFQAEVLEEPATPPGELAWTRSSILYFSRVRELQPATCGELPAEALGPCRRGLQASLESFMGRKLTTSAQVEAWCQDLAAAHRGDAPADSMGMGVRTLRVAQEDRADLGASLPEVCASAQSSEAMRAE